MIQAFPATMPHLLLFCKTLHINVTFSDIPEKIRYKTTETHTSGYKSLNYKNV